MIANRLLHHGVRWAAVVLLLSLVPSAAPAEGARVFGVGSVPDVLVLGEGAYLGVRLQEETEHPEGGARITHVVSDSPADRAGLREGDIVVGFDGDTIRGPVALTERIHAAEPDSTVTLEVVREGRERQFEVRLDKREPPWTVLNLDDLKTPGLRFEGVPAPEVTPLCDDGDCGFLLGFGSRPKLGVQLVETTPELREHLGGSEDAGVLVSKVLPGSAAERAGLQVGDLIVEVAGERVRNTAAIRRALVGEDGKSIDVRVVRDGKSVRVPVVLPARDEERPTGPRAWILAPPSPEGPRLSVAVGPDVAAPVAVGVAPDVGVVVAPQAVAAVPSPPSPPPAPAPAVIADGLSEI